MNALKKWTGFLVLQEEHRYYKLSWNQEKIRNNRISRMPYAESIMFLVRNSEKFEIVGIRYTGDSLRRDYGKDYHIGS